MGKKVIKKKVQKKTTSKAKAAPPAKKAVAKPVVAKRTAPVRNAKKPVRKPVKKTIAKKVVKKLAKKVSSAKSPAKVTKTIAKKEPAQQKIEKVKETKTKEKKVVDPDAVPQAYAAYSVDEYKKYLAAKDLWSKKSNADIKAALKLNGQTMSGNKDEIVVKVADGIVLGAIPRCPNCYGGRPKYDQKTGSYYCVGFRDDTDFRWCRKTFASLPRTPWQE